MPDVNAEIVREHDLGFYPVFDGDQRKIRTIRLAGFGVGTGWTRRAVAAANVVKTHHKKTRGINRFARTDKSIPPACFFIIAAMIASRMMTAR